MKIKILIPIFNDWESVLKLLENINFEISKLNHDFSVILVDDASTITNPKFEEKFHKIQSIKLIKMRENRGHARCNAAGLKYIFENEEFDYVIPMDGDGEDRPEEIKNFVANLNYQEDQAIVGERIKRSEGLFFQCCYLIHKLLTYAFTGKSIRYGNYSCLPKSVIEKMINEKATWSSFSGSLAKVTNKRLNLPSERGSRYFGPSKMSFKNLLVHSLSIIGVFKYNVLIRSMIFLIVYFSIISQNITFVTLIPIFCLLFFNISVFNISKRENFIELKNSLNNISKIETIK